VIVISSFVFGAIAQVVSSPFSFLSTGLTTIISPTGDPDPSAIIAIVVAVVLTQVVTLLIQSVAVVVQATATSIIYIDCRMRREGLDIDLLTYIERRDSGAVGLPDPYRENVGRIIAPRPTAYPAPGYPPPYGAPAYGAPGYAPQGYAPQGYPPAAPQGYPAYPAQSYPTHPPQGYPAPQPQGYPAPRTQPAATTPVVPPPPTAAPAPAPAENEEQPPAPTRWAAPGASTDAIDPESPWS
jgi:hypothetical protein